MLTVRQLAFGYPDHPVGRDVNFELESGEVLCVLGPNGCGKTTLFKTVLGLLKAQAGTICVNDEDIDQWPRQRIASTMAYVPQQHDAYFPFTVLELVLMGRGAHLGLFSAPSSHDRDVAVQALRSLAIEHLQDAVYTRLSGGERQLTLIARALAQEPKILAMDEPTANLDFGNQILVLRHINRLARAGIAIVLSTHNPGHTFRVAHRVALMKNGRFLELGVPTQVVTPDALHRIYGVDVNIAQVTNISGKTTQVCVPTID